MAKCKNCEKNIPKARQEALPGVDTCVGCSEAKPMMGFMDWAHKTAPELVMVSTANPENIRRAKRINVRAR
jgi:hypothetical protein